MKQKRVIFTMADVIAALMLHYWCFWLMFYYSASIDGAIYISSSYAIWERNYLVPLQLIGIPIAVTLVSVTLFRRLRRRGLIGKGYIGLVLFNVLPLFAICVFFLTDFAYYFHRLY